MGIRSFFPPINFPDHLPITAHLEEIRQALLQYQVIVVAGETGSGKTTQLPKLALQLGRGCEKLIGHTQPRRIAARSVAQRLAEELETTLGDKVGFQVRFHQQYGEQAYIKVMTDGILLAELSQDRLLKKYDTLIIDEAHERSLNIDFILGYLKWLLPRRPDLKIIITSATLDHQRFSRHFKNCPVIEVSGRGYPVELIYQELDRAQTQDIAQRQGIAKAIKALDEDGDVLVFLSGERDIRQTDEFLRKSGLRHTEILPLYSRLTPAEQQKVFQSHHYRRVILATNVAETSLTIPNIKYVIDTGVARIKRYNARSKIQRLPIEPISQASAKQRAGRCGRTSPGICIRLYSAEDFNLREAYTQPEILRSNLASVILQMLALRLGDPEQFPWLDPPESQYWRDAYQCLEELQAIQKHQSCDRQGAEMYSLTSIGKQLAQLPLDPRLGRMLITATEKHCVNEVLIIVSALSVADIFVRPSDQQQAADEKHREFFDVRSDFLTYLNVWQKLTEIQQHQSNNKLRQFCDTHFLSYLRFREWQDLHHELRESVKSSLRAQRSNPGDAQRRREPEGRGDPGFKNLDCAAKLAMTDQQFIIIHQSLLSGLLTNVAQKDEEGSYLSIRQKNVKIFPGSGLFKKPPAWLMAMEIVETKKIYARTVASIDPTWVEQLAPHLIKKTHSEPHWDARRGEVLANEKVLLFGLVIVPRRRVRYAHLDPKLSHEVFLRQALAQRQLKTTLKFWLHNEKFLSDLEQLEEKTRSRHFVPDEDWLYRFYQNKIPTDICGQVAIEKWYRVASEEIKASLELTEKHLEQLQNTDAQAYPTEFIWQGNRLKLSYQFAPGSVEDGVSLHLPLGLLQDLPAEIFDGLVPGFLEQKILAVLKELPKEMRKALMPMNEAVKTVLLFFHANASSQAQRGDPAFNIDFFETIVQALKENFQLKVSKQALSDAPIPEFLRFNFKIIQDQKLLAQGRDLFALKQKFLLHEKVTDDAVSIFKEWPKNLPEHRQQKEKNLFLTKYPALQAHGEGVAIVEVSKLMLAKQIHRFGVAKLLRLKCKDQLDYVVKKLLNVGRIKRSESALSAIKADSLRLIRPTLTNDFIAYFEYALIFMTFAEDFWQIRTEENFLDCYQTHHKDLLENANSLVPVVQSIMQQAQQLNVETTAELLFPGFLATVPWEWLERYPLYLTAMLIGKWKETGLENLYQQVLEKALRENNVIMNETEVAFDPLILFDLHSCVSEQLMHIYYLLYELKMSLGAPQLKPVESVSVVRLQKMLGQLL